MRNDEEAGDGRWRVEDTRREKEREERYGGRTQREERNVRGGGKFVEIARQAQVSVFQAAVNVEWRNLSIFEEYRTQYIKYWR